MFYVCLGRLNHIYVAILGTMLHENCLWGNTTLDDSKLIALIILAISHLARCMCMYFFEINIAIAIFCFVICRSFSSIRSIHRMCSVRKGVLRNFAKFTGKHLCQSLFFKKETLAQVFSCEICDISKNTFFTEHLWATAFVVWTRSKIKKSKILNSNIHAHVCERISCYSMIMLKVLRNVIFELALLS